LKLLLWSIVPAAAFVLLVTGLFQHGPSAAGIMHTKMGWMQEDQGFFRFWFTNFGILPVLALALLGWTVVGARKSSQADTAFSFVFPSLFVFGISCVVMFAAWEWDNMKIFIWCYLCILPFLYEMLALIPFPYGAPVRAVCYVMLFLSGFVSLLGGLDATHTGYDIAVRSELDPVSHAVRNLSAESTFAGSPTYNHPLLLSGCKMVEGYDGHLFSHGIQFGERKEELTAMMRGGSNWREIAVKLQVRYIYWGPREAQEYAGSTEPWKGMPVAAAGDWGTIYDLGR
jgi:hypothetical protein